MKKSIAVMIIAATLCLCAFTAGAIDHKLPQAPLAEHNLILSAPVNTWDEALPLGNGLMGGLLWGEDSTVRLSLDRGDLWDERTHGEKEWWKKHNYKAGQERIAQKDFATVHSWWDDPYNGVTPTKLPGGRLEITLDPKQKLKAFELDLATAEGFARFKNGSQLRAFFSAAESVALMRIPGQEPKALDLTPAGASKERGNAGPSSGGAVAKLGYPPAKYGSEGGMKWYVQDTVGDFKYCVCIASRRLENETLLAITVTSTNDAADLLAIAKKRCVSALEAGYDNMRKAHVAWWKAFWSKSAVSIPAGDAHILRQYYLVQYFYGAASRRGAPPMPLQGVWTADNGGLPPWKGDYHNDLNTQMTYMAYQSSGRFNQGASYLDYLWERRDVFRDFARDFYQTDGLACPGVMTLAGQPLGGWGQYSMSPTMSAWSAHLFYLHWRYTMDDDFLRSRAYPWCADVGKCMRGLLKRDADGILKLPLSSSPEVFDASARAWLEPNTNYDLMCLKMLFLSLQEMAEACGRAGEATVWRSTAALLGDYHADSNGMLLMDAKTPIPYSHRHLSNLMAIHPFNLITTDGGTGDAQRIKASMAQWDNLGTAAWCGYSFSWMSCLKARIGDAESALRNLDIYAKAFILRNGFHVNGDQTRSGFSGYTYRPFTLEGNFLASQAVQEMLLQSWSPTPGKRDTEIIRIFPATPWRWHDAAFRDLRTEGAHKVSAVRENNATIWLRIVAGKSGPIRIRDNFAGRMPEWSIPNVKKIGDNYRINLKKGQAIEATLAKPPTIPQPPSDLAEPVLIRNPLGIGRNKLPLRIGADSNGGNMFQGDLARIAVFNRVLAPGEVAKLAEKKNKAWAKIKGAVVTLGSEQAFPNKSQLVLKLVKGVQVLDADGGLSGKMFRLSGQGYLEISHHKSLDCLDGVTLSVWVRPTVIQAAGARIIDKTPVGAAAGYMIDSWPDGRSFRLITRDPHIIQSDVFRLNQWTHVAATVDGKTGKQTLYVNGAKVKESQ